MTNSFKQIESDESCPPAVREAIVAEIGLIRNTLSVVELYTGDLFATISALLANTAPDTE